MQPKTGGPFSRMDSQLAVPASRNRYPTDGVHYFRCSELEIAVLLIQIALLRKFE